MSILFVDLIAFLSYYISKGGLKMKERIKKIRKEQNMTQQSFADKLGLKRQTIAAYEIGNIEPSNAVILSICREFNVNEKWLRTGNGEPYLESTKDERYFKNVAKLQRADDETLMRWVNAIAETSPDALKEIEVFMKKILGIEE